VNDDVPGEPTAPPATPLTPFQIEVSSAFFDLPESRGFLLAGGAALVAQHLITRPTRDLDFFTSLTEAVPAAADAFRALAGRRGWQVTTIREASSFVRLHVHHGADEVLVDLAVDAAPGLPPGMTVAGPTLDPVELAARKLIALFDRAEPRDFADVYVLAKRYGRDELLAQATRVDSGITTEALAEMLDTLGRLSDDDVPLEPDAIDDVRRFFATWASDLRSPGASD
jgi:hypothetical protein